MKTTEILETVKKGFANPNRYTAEITPPISLSINGRSNVLKLINLNCHKADIPGTSIATKESNIGGMAVTKMPHSRQYGDANFSFYVSENMVEKEIFDAWQNMIITKNNQIISFYNDYIGEMIVNKLDKKNNIVAKYIYKEVYPINVSTVAVDYQSENQVLHLPVSFAYKNYEAVYVET